MNDINPAQKINAVGTFTLVDCVWNVMAHAQKPDFVFRRNGRVHLNRRGHKFSRLLAAEVSASAVVMLDTSCSEVMWRVLATHSVRQFPLHFPSRASPWAITFQLDSTCNLKLKWNVMHETLAKTSHPNPSKSDIYLSGLRLPPRCQ